MALTPGCLNLIGRSLVRYGESVHYVTVHRGMVRLLPVTYYDIQGDAKPESWRYLIQVQGPTRHSQIRNVGADSILHVRYATDPAQWWRGIGPIESAALAGRLSAETLALLADEASGPRGTLLPLPVDGDDPTVGRLKAKIPHRSRENIACGVHQRRRVGRCGLRRPW